MTTLFVLLALLNLYVCIRGESQCGNDGIRTPATECPTLFVLSKKMNETYEDFKLQSNSSCGNAELRYIEACREDDTCFTPDESIGRCVNYKECEPITHIRTSLPISKENITYILNSRCEGPVRTKNVCCGSKINNHVKTRPSSCEPTAMPRDPQTRCCGVSTCSSPKIYAGTTPRIDQFPWMALIEYYNAVTQKIVLGCGGSLISQKYVLTAAHCVLGNFLKTSTPINVRLGEFDLSSDGQDCVDDDCTNGIVVIPIEKIRVHKSYNAYTHKHDIALIRLKDFAPYNDFIRPICLPTRNIYYEKSPITTVVAGWGWFNDSKIFSNVLQYVELPLTPKKECQLFYGEDFGNGQICAGGVDGEDSCRGDSGGPLITMKGMTQTVNGIVSYGSKDCGIGKPGVYTNVYEYMPWLRTHMKP